MSNNKHEWGQMELSYPLLFYYVSKNKELWL